jgi:hypothetical protein
MNPCPLHFRRPERPGLPLAGILAVMLWLLSCPDASAQVVSGRLSTSFYTWERYDTVDVSTVYLRAFQTVQLSAAQGDVSLHTYMTGALMTPGEANLARFYNLYLRWANIGDVLDLSAGRQAVYAGVGTGTIDGLAAKLRLLDGRVSLFTFAGAAPSVGYRGVRSNFHDNVSAGGQIVTTLIPDTRLGISYLHRNEERDPYWTLRARDTAYTPVAYYVTFEPDAEELLGVDLSYRFGERLSFYGRYDHDLKNERASRVQGSLRVSVTPLLALTAEYMHRLPRVSFNSIFSAFVQNALYEIEGGAEYEFAPRFRAFGRLASLELGGEKSARWSLGVTSGFGSATYAGGSGVTGEIQSFSLQAVYPVEEFNLIPSAGVAYASYRLSSGEETRQAWSVVAGGTYRPMASLSIDLQGQWLANRIYASALNGFVKFNYWFRERLGLFGREEK